MKIQTPENANYAGVVVTIKEVHPFENSDNIVGTTIFGSQAIVGKDTKVGDVGIFFPAETQLSQEYCYENNLHQHGNLNRDQGSKGYLGDNRRIRAIRLRNNRSDCLFMPLTSLSYVKGLKLADLKEGDTFDQLGDHKICNKYVVQKTNKEKRLEKNKNKVFSRVDKKFLPEHYDTDNYFRNVETIPVGRWVTITQKLHGTSIRVGHTIVSRKLTIRDRLAKVAGANVKDTEMDYVFGSRKVIKDINNPNQNHFYSTDIWTEEGKKLEGIIPENFLVYGELIGYTPEGGLLQKNYTYKVPHPTCDMYIYRVAFLNEKGFVVDLSWDQVKEFCNDRGLKHVPELYSGPMPTEGEIVSWFIDKRFRDDGYPQAVDLDKESPVDEGVCIRVDAMQPYILKAKSPKFLEHETKMLDEEATDLEAENS
jgi:hypothetical protein